MEQESMKPCPLCGGEVRIHRRTDGQVDGIVCDECLLTLEAVDVYPEWHTLDELVRRWNARAGGTCRMEYGKLMDGVATDYHSRVCTSCAAKFEWNEVLDASYCPNCGARIEVMKG